MNKEQYMKKILRGIKVTDIIKERIRYDIQTEIESMEESGLTIEEIISKKGNPEKVAAVFNQSYSNTKMRRQYHTQKFLKTAAIVLLPVSLLILIYSTFLTQDASMAIIGGADGPTNIVVTKRPIPYGLSPFAEGNIIGCVLLILGIVCIVTYFVMKKTQ